MKRQLRNLQTFAPWIRPLKFGFYNFLSRHFGAHIDPDFQILRHCPEMRHALDIGGNWGQSVIAVRRMRPDAAITTFEPNPLLAARMERDFSGDARVTVRNCALSSEAGTMTLHVPVYRDFVYDGLASLDKQEAAHWLNAERVWNFDEKKLSIQSFEVDVMRLDALQLEPDFIKIDVQGHELAVLEGAPQTLARQPIVLLEDASEEIVTYLSGFGLRPYRFTGDALVEGDLSSVNTFFMTADRAEALGLSVRQAAA